MRTLTEHGRLAWVIGSPLEHTGSPALHNAAFEAADLPHRYFALEVEPDDLDRFLQFVRDLNALGANLTLPLKETIRDHIPRESERVAALRAANTLYWEGDSLALENTDVHGFRTLVEPWEERIRDRPVVLLGAGGAARACLYALNTMGCSEILLWNRTTRKARSLRDEFAGAPVEVLSDEQLRQRDTGAGMVINATSLGLDEEDPSPFPRDRITAGMIGVDLIYGVSTRFQEDFSRSGEAAVDGMTMLVSQAAKSWQLWVGTSPDESAMEDAADRFLEEG